MAIRSKSASMPMKFTRSPNRTIDLQPNHRDLTSTIDVVSPARSGLFQQVLALAHSLLPGQTAKVTVTTIEIESPPQKPVQDVIDIIPAPMHHSVRTEPIARDMVERMLRLAHNRNELGRRYDWTHTFPERLADGTSMIVLLDRDTGLMHGWTICPLTLKPKHLGWLNR